MLEVARRQARTLTLALRKERLTRATTLSLREAGWVKDEPPQTRTLPEHISEARQAFILRARRSFTVFVERWRASQGCAGARSQAVLQQFDTGISQAGERSLPVTERKRDEERIHHGHGSRDI